MAKFSHLFIFIYIMDIQFNTKNVRRVPINRNSLFYDAETFEFDINMGKEYIEKDMGQTVVLYQVDVHASQTDAVYGETKPNGIVFKTPVEVPCIYKIDAPELKAYNGDKNFGTYVKDGKLTINVYQATMDELGVDMKKGDYIGIQVNPSLMHYWTVINDGRNNLDNKHTMYGTVPFYRTVMCAPVDSSEFNG